jgi:hypothetical protein
MDEKTREEQRVTAMLPAAHQGDETAVYEVAMYVFKRWKSRIRKFYTLDPAYDREDLEDVFMHGILAALPLGVHTRPNPLWHLSERGYWAVGSFIRSIRQRPHMVHEDEDTREVLVEQVEDPVDYREIVVSRSAAQERVVHILANSSLRDKPRLAVEAILSGEVGDPTELGFNKNLAEYLKVSPQRASQIMAEVERIGWRSESGLSD